MKTRNYVRKEINQIYLMFFLIPATSILSIVGTRCYLKSDKYVYRKALEEYYNKNHEKTLSIMQPLSPKFKSQFHVKNVETECYLNIISGLIEQDRNEYALKKISELPSDIYKKDEIEQLERDAKTRMAEAIERQNQLAMQTAETAERLKQQMSQNNGDVSANRVLTLDTRKRIFWDLVSEEDKAGFVSDSEKCRRIVAQRHGISVDSVFKIQVEGV